MLPTKLYPKHHIHTPFEHFQIQWTHHLPGQPISVPDDIFPFLIYLKPTLVQLENISSCPVPCYNLLSGISKEWQIPWP